jgi:hypothetical protein
VKIQNRIFRNQPDYLLVIVRRPPNWKPRSLEQAPPAAERISATPVASFGEAHDDLIRCNTLALRTGKPFWAIIEAPGGAL